MLLRGVPRLDGARRKKLEMAQAANGRVFERAADDMFSGWISPSRPLVLKKPLHFFWVNRITRWQSKWVKSLGICLALFCRCCIFRRIRVFPTWALPQARLAGQAYTSRKFSLMGITSCMSVAVRWIWCWVASWKERASQRFDGVLWVFFNICTKSQSLYW